MSLTLYERLPVDAQVRLDRVCGRFETAWAGPTPPDLEAYLADAPPAERAAWLTEFLHIEIECRRRAGDHPNPDEYHTRFPGDADVIDEVFAAAPGVRAGSRVGKYLLGQPLGRGGMGVVFAATDTVLGRPAAVKLLGGKDATGVIEEARLAGRKQHPNIVTVFEAGKEDGVWYMAMERLPGSAADRLKAGPLSPAAATRIAADVCRGLVAAHAAGLVHRDIKPANVLLTTAAEAPPPGLPTAKLTDFGLARLDPTAGPVGTPAYMAPEQFETGPVGPAADVYALGATFYTLLTGKAPFPADTAPGARDGHRTGRVPDPRSVTPGVPAAAARVVARAMAKDPADRYPTAEAMLADLDVLLDGSRPRPRRWVVAAVLAVGLAAVGVWLAPGSRLALVAVPGPPPAPPPAAWQPLFNGTDLTGWDVFVSGHAPGEDPNEVFTVVTKDGEPAIRASAEEIGTITTAREFGNYHFRCEYRWETLEGKHNTGVMYHCTGDPGAGFTGARKSHELEIMPRNVGGYYRSGGHRLCDVGKFADGIVTPVRPCGERARVTEDREFKTGRWSVIELYCWEDSALHVVNGEVVFAMTRSRVPAPAGADVPLTRGRIALQSYGGEVYFRRVECRPIDRLPERVR